MDSYRLYVYETEKKLSEKVTYGPDGSVRKTVSYTYDKEGKKTKKNTYSADGKIKEYALYSY